MTPEQFNAEHPVGSAFRFYPIAGGRSWWLTRTTAPAKLKDGRAVVALSTEKVPKPIEHLVKP